MKVWQTMNGMKKLLKRQIYQITIKYIDEIERREILPFYSSVTSDQTQKIVFNIPYTTYSNTPALQLARSLIKDSFHSTHKYMIDTI